jgi:hypothetical protein
MLTFDIILNSKTLSLTDPCLNHPTIIHEFLHAIGLTHEHKRIDRDDHIIVYWENIRPGSVGKMFKLLKRLFSLKGKEGNFVKVNPNRYTTYDTPYETKSLMHYSEKAFSKNGLPTLGSKV